MISGRCLLPSPGLVFYTPWGLDGSLSPCSSGRFLEQQPTEPSRGQPQQEDPRQPEQQCWLPGLPNVFRQSRCAYGRIGRALLRSEPFMMITVEGRVEMAARYRCGPCLGPRMRDDRGRRFLALGG